MLEQQVGIIVQQKWITSLLGYDFVIQYKKKKENVVADTLSRKHEMGDRCEGLLTMISFPNIEWLEELKSSYGQSFKLSIII